MTPAEELRTAAQTLRERLADPELTPGPWLSLDHGDRLLYDGPDAESKPPVYVVDEPMSNGANALWIETMHPGVGTALADWLEWEADTASRTAWAPINISQDRALAVARQLLGTEATR